MPQPKLILVHGWGLHSAIWQPLLELLEPEIDCLCLDMPGYGSRTEESSPCDLEPLADDLLSMAPDKAHWAAWSLGGMAALQAALKAPERFLSLSLIGSTPRFMHTEGWETGMDPAIFEKFSAELANDYHSGIRKFLLLQAGTGSHAKQAAKSAAELLKQRPAPSAVTLGNGLEILKKEDLRKDLQELRIPCQIISGQRDRVVHPDAGNALKNLIPDAILHEINSGHAPQLSNTQELSALLKQLLINEASQA